MKRDCPEKSQAQTSYKRGPKREFSFHNCDKKGHLAQDCRGPKRNCGQDTPMTEKKIMKVFQDIMMRIFSK